MAGTKAGAVKARITNKARHGVDFYKRIGQIGGRNGTTGGFASNPELARVAGRKGGTISRRGHPRPIMDARTGSDWTQAGRADLHAHDITCPYVQLLVNRLDDTVEIAGQAWWRYIWRETEFMAGPLEQGVTTAYEYLPADATDQAVDEAMARVTEQLQDKWRGYRMPASAPVMMAESPDGRVCYKLDGLSGHVTIIK